MSGIITHEDGVYFGLPEAEHHADPALGSSSIKALLQAPEEYWGSSHLNPMREARGTTATRLGSAYHALILEGEEVYRERYAVKPEASDYPGALCTAADLKAECERRALKQTGTKPVLAARLRDDGYDGVIFDGVLADFEENLGTREPISASEDAEIRYMAAFVAGNPFLAKAFTGGFPEVSVFWTLEDGTRGKARFDYLKVGAGIDLKTFGNSYGMRPDSAVDKTASQQRHDVQAAWYHHGLNRHAVPLAAQGKVFCPGGRTPSDEWLNAFVTGGERDMIFVYQRRGGIPIARGRRFSPKMQTMKTALQECEVALEVYRSCREEFGEDAAWIRPAPIDDFQDEAFCWVRR